jgi:hypothetical protein
MDQEFSNEKERKDVIDRELENMKGMGMKFWEVLPSILVMIDSNTFRWLNTSF